MVLLEYMTSGSYPVSGLKKQLQEAVSVHLGFLRWLKLVDGERKGVKMD